MDYCPYYCEENVWRLLRRPEFAGGRAFAVFILGRNGRAAVFQQKAGSGPHGFVLWDYHVAALADGASGEPIILDFDSRLGWPVPAADWALASLVPPEGFRYDTVPYEPLLRVLPGPDFARRFRSDRSHMRKPDGTWLSPPPPWPWPHGDAGAATSDAFGDPDWTLEALLDPRRSGAGVVLAPADFLAMLEGRGAQTYPD